MPRTLIPMVLAALVTALAASPIAAQQIADATDTLFPGQDPEEWSNQLSIGDIDNDGDLDIIFANGGNFSTAGPDLQVSVYNNRGGAQYKDESVARTGGLTGIFRGVEMGDCDRDGDLDVLLVQDFDRLPELLINDGTGFFTAEGAARLPSIVLSSSRGQFGDVDNDGDLDIFVTSGSGNRFGCGQYRLYVNDGTCNYTDATAAQFPIGNVCENMDCIFGDIDNDFDLDIRTAGTGSNNSRLYRNDGTGVFTLDSGAPNDTTCYSYDFGDIDGDGDLDLVGANGFNGSQAEILLRNDGTGTFANISGQISPNPSQDDNDSKYLDYDNDGDLDLLIARLGSGGEKLYDNDGTGVFTQVTGIIEAISDSSLDIGVGDLNNDGTLDVVTAQGESGDYTNRIYINSGAADTWAPTIVDTEQLADTADTAGPYAVRALILDQMTSDRNFFDGGIVLRYSVDAGPDLSVPMLYSGGQVYRGEIPGQPQGSSVQYWVEATDFNGNVGIGSTLVFEVMAAAVPAGRISDDSLVVGKSGSQIQLGWGDSCLIDDNDYAVYEGNLGDYTSHLPRTCSVGGTSLALTPSTASSYYLVVPQNGSNEGSYGLDGMTMERAASAAACAVQSVGSCP